MIHSSSSYQQCVMSDSTWPPAVIQPRLAGNVSANITAASYLPARSQPFHYVTKSASHVLFCYKYDLWVAFTLLNYNNPAHLRVLIVLSHRLCLPNINRSTGRGLAPKGSQCCPVHGRVRPTCRWTRQNASIWCYQTPRIVLICTNRYVLYFVCLMLWAPVVLLCTKAAIEAHRFIFYYGIIHLAQRGDCDTAYSVDLSAQPLVLRSHTWSVVS